MAETTVRCALCGHVFDPAALACHPACPMHAGCAVICCPQCGYQMVNEARSGTVAWLRRMWETVNRRPAAGQEELR